MRALDTTDVTLSLSREVASVRESLDSCRLRSEVKRRELDKTFQQLVHLRRDALLQMAIEEIEYRGGTLAGMDGWIEKLGEKERMRSGQDSELSRAAAEQLSDLIRFEGDRKLILTLEHKDTAFCSFQRRLARLSPRFQRLYPATTALIKRGRLVVDLSDYSEPIKLNLMVPSIQFPPLQSRTGATTSRKKTIAQDYLNFIQYACKETRCYEPNLFDTYLSVERKKVPDKNVDKLIDLRQQFISHLKTLRSRCDTH